MSEDTYTGKATDPLSLNLYTYCENDPINNIDPSGHVVETILDIASIGWSAYDLWKNPSWGNLGFLAWDVGATIVPFAPGSYVAKGGKIVNKVDDIGKGLSEVIRKSDDVGGAIAKGAAETVKTAKGVLKDAKLPTEGMIRYVPPEKWTPSQPLPKQGGGFVDKFGNVWTKGPSRTNGQAFEWDVQLSKTGKTQLGWASRDGSHLNVSLDGKITHK